jgi:hypothetical protein
MSLKDNMEQLEKLVTNKSNANLEIIKSHTLEILLSMSEDPAFIQEMENRANMLKAFITSLDDLTLRHKILLLLVNLSSDKSLANLIVSLGCVKELYKIIFETMKQINIEHLEISKSMLVQSKEESTEMVLKTEEQKPNNTLQEKKYKISDQAVNSSEMNKMIQLDYIKLSIMIFINCSLFSNKARSEILGLQLENLVENEELEGENEKLRNLKIVIDWVAHPQIGSLFKDFIFVLTNLSSDPDLRTLLVENSLNHFSRVFSCFETLKSSERLLQICQIFRNFSFEYENQKLRAKFNENKYIQRVFKLTSDSSFSVYEQKRFMIILVDLLWLFHTNIEFDKQEDIQISNFRFEDDQNVLAQLLKDEDLVSIANSLPETQDFKDKLEGLNQLFGSYN